MTVYRLSWAETVRANVPDDDWGWNRETNEAVARILGQLDALSRLDRPVQPSEIRAVFAAEEADEAR